jgi:nitroimidazol reductase NimA-like FMN-containing flavoprotein (pyridoxamine 5'-phosphate oxidase superfamily)
VVDPLSQHPGGWPDPGTTPRSRIRRLPEKSVADRAVLRAILDAGLVAHVGIVDEDQPYVLPVAYARDDEHVLFHGSTGSRLFMGLAEGAPACLTVTLLDGLVVARSAFESSMHYRSVMAVGTCEVLTDDAKLEALHRISEHLMPGRWADSRPPTRKELAATTVLALPLDDVAVKVSDGPPDDADDDVALPLWAGVLPIREAYGAPVDAPDLRPGQPVPDYVRAWRR